MERLLLKYCRIGDQTTQATNQMMARVTNRKPVGHGDVVRDGLGLGLVRVNCRFCPNKSLQVRRRKALISVGFSFQKGLMGHGELVGTINRLEGQTQGCFSWKCTKFSNDAGDVCINRATFKSGKSQIQWPVKRRCACYY